MKKKVGVFFGSFNPIHHGHMSVAVTAQEEAGLDCVLFVVSPQNPHKDKSILCDKYSRSNMVELSVGDLDKNRDRFGVSEIEFDMPSPSYTIDAIETLKKTIPNVELYLIFGLDTASKILSWKEGERILEENNLLIYERAGFSRDVPDFLLKKNHKLLVSDVKSEISSTSIRKRIKEGKPINFLVSPSVSSYIRENHLFIDDENGINREVQVQGRPGVV